MQLVPHDPTEGVYPATDDYVHAMEVRGAQRLLFVAGTMGLDAGGTPGRCDHRDRRRDAGP
jgi:2-iminobutanoate/2-iminopropanoate deaminase